MITSPFEYHKPDNIKDVISLLSEWGEDARVIAGGHSLIPLMKQRMTDIAHLIDLRAVQALKGITIQAELITIGAMTTQHELITHDALAEVAPIIREAALQIADPQVRYLGTVGGNAANGDPANDLPGLMLVLDATYHLEGPKGQRDVQARDFYEAAYFTARADDEILTAISFKPPQGGSAYEKQKRKIGDYATAAAGVLLQVEGDKCVAAAIGLTNLADTPINCQDAVDILVGSALDEAAIKQAVKAAVDASSPAADTRGPVEFKKYLAGVIIKRAITNARARA